MLVLCALFVSCQTTIFSRLHFAHLIEVPYENLSWLEIPKYQHYLQFQRNNVIIRQDGKSYSLLALKRNLICGRLNHWHLVSVHCIRVRRKICVINVKLYQGILVMKCCLLVEALMAKSPSFYFCLKVKLSRNFVFLTLCKIITLYLIIF